MLNTKKKKGPRTHEEALRSICGCCLQKGPGLIKISPSLLDRIQKYQFQQYSLDNPGLPRAICNGCRAKLHRLEKNPDSVNNLPKIKYEKLQGPRPLTRHTAVQACNCSICQLARATLHWETKALLEQFISSPSTPSAPSPEYIKICKVCLSQIGQGLSHTCSKSTFREKISDLVREKSEKTKGRVVSTLLKGVYDDQNVDKEGGTVHLATGSKPLKVTLGAEAAGLMGRRKFFSHKDLVQIKTNRNLSDKEILGLATDIRGVFGRNAVESGLKAAIIEKNHVLDHIYDIKTKVMKGKKDKTNGEYPSVECTGVACTDPSTVEELIQIVMKERGYNPYNVKGLVGLDDGQGMLKVGFTLQEVTEEGDDENNVQPGQKAVGGRNKKDSGVKKLILLAVYPNVPECHENISNILSDLGIDAIDFGITADLKMMLILIGKPQGKPKFNCPFCNGTAPFSEPYDLYTLGDLYALHQAFVDTGSPYLRQSNYQNIVNIPLLTGDPERLVLDMLNPPSLHLLLGVVNKLIDTMEVSLFDNKDEGEKWMDDYLTKQCIIRKKKQGRRGLEGNQASKFLHKVDNMELALSQQGEAIMIKGAPYVAVMRAYLAVQSSCMGSELKTDYIKTISSFTEAYTAIPDISVTPKVHIIMHHLTEFFNIKGKDHGLSFYSEQAVEAVHYDFKNFWNKYAVEPENPNFGRNLKSAVSAYVSSHV